MGAAKPFDGATTSCQPQEGRCGSKLITTDLKAADTNDDKKINATDLLAMKAHIKGMKPL
ncbi:MAG: hypothetical protein IJ571_06960 [Ruminococcus sp.]|nr:hypothetical protein [Ruminococcus sp.]